MASIIKGRLTKGSAEGIKTLGNITNAVGHAQSLNKTLAGALVVAILLLALSLAVNGLLIATRPAPKYFASTADLRVLPLTPLDQPVITDAALANWVAESVTSTLTLDFISYREQLYRVQDRYTSNAFADLIQSLKNNQVFSTILERRLVMHTSIASPPHIVSTSFLGGRKVWTLQVPVTISYEGSNGVVTTQRAMATVVVQRVSEAETPTGIKIAQLNMKVI